MGNPKFHFEEQNTEGKHETSFRFDDTEIKKGDKIVATDLADLYDCDVKTVPPVDGDVLTFIEASQKWEPRQPEGGGGCQLVEGTLFFYVFLRYDIEGDQSSYSAGTFDVSYNYNHVLPDGYPYNAGFAIGTYENPFRSIDEAMKWLSANCTIIHEPATVNIIVMSDQSPFVIGVGGNCGSDTGYEPSFICEYPMPEVTYPYSNRVFIYGFQTTERITSVQDWNLRTPLLIQLRANFEVNYTEYMGGPSLNVGITKRFYHLVMDAFLPFIRVKNGAALGGMLNFRFTKPYLNLSCVED